MPEHRGSGARLAVVAPLSQELAVLKRRLPRGPRLRLGAGRGWESKYAGHALLLCVCGDGRQRAEASLRALLGGHPVERVLLLGIAGGLDPELPPGALVLGREVLAVEESGGRFSRCGDSWPRTWALAPDALRDLGGVHEGTLVSASRILHSVADKASVRALVRDAGGAAVDLESACVARVCAERRVPLLVVRAVSDAAGEGLPAAFARSLRPDGSTARGRLGLELVRAPGQVPAVLRLSRRVRACAGRLAAAAEAILRGATLAERPRP